MVSLSFNRQFFPSVGYASIVFAVMHGLVVLINGGILNDIIGVNLSGFIMLIPFEVLHALVFFVFCYVLLNFPVFYLTKNIAIGRKNCIITGILFGVLFTPLAASVGYYIFLDSDSPSYWERCIEFISPMAISGAIGGFIFWRRAGSEMASNKSVADLFS